MADNSDFAQKAADDFTDRALVNARAVLHRDGADYCQGCDDPIPEARRVAMPSAIFCMDCQQEVGARGA